LNCDPHFTYKISKCVCARARMRGCVHVRACVKDEERERPEFDPVLD